MNEVQWQFSTKPEAPALGSDFIQAYPDEQREVFTEPEVLTPAICQIWSEHQP
jgi:hypothetical protein